MIVRYKVTTKSILCIMERTHVILVDIKVGQTADAELVDADADRFSTLSKARSLSEEGCGSSLKPELA